MTEATSARRGIATEEMRRHNLRAVLERVHYTASTSRSELAALTGLNRSTIRDLVGELADLGYLLEDSGTTSGGPGRPSAVARARPLGAVVLAVELEVDYTAVATVGLGGRVLGRAAAANPAPSASPKVVIDHLADLAAPLLAELPRAHRLVGVGAAAAGLVRRSDGFVSASPNRGWTDVPLGRLISERLGINRVTVANEADAGALAEYRRGDTTARNLIYVSGEVGLGLGIVQNGSAMSGDAGYAGEAGHTVIRPDGQPCRCGSTGCWETEVGEEALARHAGLSWSDGRQHLSAEVLRRAHAGDRRVLDALKEVGGWLGLGVGNLVNIFNPEVIVFGGFYFSIFPFLEPWIEQGAARSALAAPWASCAIRRSTLGADARLVGAAELVFGNVLDDPVAVATR